MKELNALYFVAHTFPRHIYFGGLRQPNLLEFAIQQSNLIKVLLQACKTVSFLTLHALLDLWTVDRPHNKQRFQLNYLVNSYVTVFRARIFLKLFEYKSIPSIESIFKGANWLERENWDMFGVFFYDHPDLRRILSDYGFGGFPMRKDFPPTGFSQVRFDDAAGLIVHEPLTLQQIFRYFYFSAPWLVSSTPKYLDVERNPRRQTQNK